MICIKKKGVFVTVSLPDAQRLGWPFLSVAESRQLDVEAIEKHGVAGIVLMENAGKGCADRILQVLSGEVPERQSGTIADPRSFANTSTMVLAGSGNNGGDGFVIGRHLHIAGHPVAVLLLASPDRLRGDAKISFDRAVDAGVSIQSVTEPAKIVAILGRHDGLIVDCLLGTGASGDPREPYASAINAANRAASVLLIAIDLPSGLDGDTAQAGEPTFRADLTLTFVTAKLAMQNPLASEWLGEVEIVDIGLPDAMMQRLR
ncbi:NAD(P)H-hydrate epimerase [Neorhodopirellula lusitana]|uniref:NAD(P)H-hydrate epimerase n=1 Tax=Neorhodopirellula lusitana TaxID=445327 RepID=A0ABY1QPH0_9BACT|nr:NAD(P)H-hydrate epimerase [Neorhodopirellula lusitana]